MNNGHWIVSGSCRDDVVRIHESCSGRLVADVALGECVGEWESGRGEEAQWRSIRGEEAQWRSIRGEEAQWRSIRGEEAQWRSIRGEEAQWRRVRGRSGTVTERDRETAASSDVSNNNLFVQSLRGDVHFPDQFSVLMGRGQSTFDYCLYGVGMAASVW